MHEIATRVQKVELRKCLLASVRTQRREFRLLPTGTGDTRTLTRPEIADYYGIGGFFPDSKRIALVATDRDGARRIYVQDVEGGSARRLSETAVTVALPISPDGKLIFARLTDGKAVMLPVDGGTPRPVPGLDPDDEVLQWSSDGKALYVGRPNAVLEKLYRVDLSSGRRELWTQFSLADQSGAWPLDWCLISRDGRFYGYTYLRVLSDLYLVEGLE